MDFLKLPRPAWMTEDLILLEDQTRRFVTNEFGPHPVSYTHLTLPTILRV